MFLVKKLFFLFEYFKLYFFFIHYKVRRKECSARAITVGTDERFTVLRGPTESEHHHAPNREFAEAEIIKMNLKCKASNHPEEPAARLLRTELAAAFRRQLSASCQNAKT